MFRCLSIVASVLAALALNAYGNTIHVPTDSATIQAGIDAAVRGDTVLVAPGVYVENIDFKRKSIVLTSWYLGTQDPSYISDTVIDGGDNGSAVTLIGNLIGNVTSASDAQAQPVLNGFTVRNGRADYGGGIDVERAVATLSNLIVTGKAVDP